MNSVVDGVPFEDVVTGYGVTVAAEAALDAGRGPGGWDGRSAAIEGFGKVGGGVAREVIRRGGRVVAVSTVAGCVADPAGLDVGRLLALRREHGDECVLRYGGPVIRPAEPVHRGERRRPGTRNPAGNDRRPDRRGAAAGRPGRRARRERALHRGGGRRCCASAASWRCPTSSATRAR